MYLVFGVLTTVVNIVVYYVASGLLKNQLFNSEYCSLVFISIICLCDK